MSQHRQTHTPVLTLTLSQQADERGFVDIDDTFVIELIQYVTHTHSVMHTVLFILEILTY